MKSQHIIFFARTIMQEIITKGKTELKAKKVLEHVIQYYAEIATDFKKNVIFLYFNNLGTEKKKERHIIELK